MPRVNPRDREIRDRLVWQMFVSGVPYREIGRHPKVKLSCRGVELSVLRTMELDRPHQELLTAEARTVLLARLETLLRSAMPRAMDGNMRAVEAARKLIEQEARIMGVDRPRPGRGGDDEDAVPPGGHHGGWKSLDDYRRQFLTRQFDLNPEVLERERAARLRSLPADPPPLDPAVAEEFADAAAQLGWSSTELAMELWRDDGALIDRMASGDRWSQAHWEAVQSYRRRVERRQSELLRRAQ